MILLLFEAYTDRFFFRADENALGLPYAILGDIPPVVLD